MLGDEPIWRPYSVAASSLFPLSEWLSIDGSTALSEMDVSFQLIHFSLLRYSILIAILGFLLRCRHSLCICNAAIICSNCCARMIGLKHEGVPFSRVQETLFADRIYIGF